MDDDRYILGSSPHELKRLALQGKVLRPTTQRLLREAGLRDGMRVLDLGCGAGDVSLLAADMVGPTGYVLGIDGAPQAIAAAESRQQHTGMALLEFQLSSVDDFMSTEAFDVAIGRCVLAHQSDPQGFIRSALRHIRPGGVIAFHEMIFQHGFHSRPTVGLWDKTAEWLCAALKIDGPGRDAAGRFTEHFAAVGLECPALFAELAVGGCAASPLYAWVAESVRTVTPDILALGIATKEEIDIETLEERLRKAVVEANAQIAMPPQVCAWAPV